MHVAVTMLRVFRRKRPKEGINAIVVANTANSTKNEYIEYMLMSEYRSKKES